MKKPSFKVGDPVFYPAAGVGVIEGLENIYIGGQWEQCFVIRFYNSHAVIKVPQSNLQKNGIRPLLNPRRVKELFRILSGKPMQRATGNWTERYKDIERKINSGSSFDLGEVVRDLTRWKQQHGLSFEEARLLETASNYLAHEIATVQGVPQEIAFDRIRSHIGASADAA